MNNTKKSCSIDNQILDIIIKIFQIIGEFGRNIEIIRQVLCDSSNFDINLIFKILVKKNKCVLTPNDFFNFLQSNLIFCDLETIKILISFYDINNDGNLNFEEFKNILISHKDPGLKSYSKLNENVFDYLLPNNISHTMVKLFIQEIQFACKLLQLQKIIISYPSYNVWNLFCLIDKENIGSIKIDR